jgi:hypothetical protein
VKMGEVLSGREVLAYLKKFPQAGGSSVKRARESVRQ